MLSAVAVEGPAACFDAAGDTLARPMAEMLHGLAQDGFFQLSSRDDACAKIVQSCGVGGIVSSTEYFAGAHVATWAGPHPVVVVPSCQTTRLILAGDARVQGASHHRCAALQHALQESSATRRSAAAAANTAATGSALDVAWWVRVSGSSAVATGGALVYGQNGPSTRGSLAGSAATSSAAAAVAPGPGPPGRVARSTAPRTARSSASASAASDGRP